MFQFIENTFSQLIRNVIVVEDNQKKRFEKLRCNVLQLYNFARKEDFVFEGKILKPRKKITVIHIGSITKSRGSLVFVDVVKQVCNKRNDIEFKFVNQYYSKLEKSMLNEKIEAENVENEFNIIDPVPSHKISELLSSADIGLSYLLPVGQSAKAIPTKFFEYMACGLAIIAEDSYYSNKFISENECGILIPYDDINGFVNAIISLADNREKLNKFGTNGRNAFENKYNWNVQESEFEYYYRNILSK